MEISLTVFLIIYFALTAIFVVFAFFNVYHAVRFGYANWTNLLSLVIFLGIAAAILILSFAFIIKADWSRTIIIFENLDFLQKYFSF